MINRWRVYISTLDLNRNYTAYREVTRDVVFDGFGSISQDLDNVDYTIGVYRTSNISITFRNDQGLYSDVGTPQSIFQYTRTNSLVKITWAETEAPECGFAVAGASTLAPEETVFIGLLNDDSFSMNLDSQTVEFQVMGRESIFDQVSVPNASIAAGNTFSTLIYTCLNQTAITRLLTVDAGNINVGVNIATDSVQDFINKSVKQALDDLLLMSNSVLYISGDSIIVSPRTATVAIQYRFYGQTSINGPENIQNITGIKNGLSRTFNYISWNLTSPVTSTLVQDASSILRYGIRDKQFNQTFITNIVNQATVLNAILSEFKNPLQEFELTTQLNRDTLDIALLDRIEIDYPVVYVSDEFEFPICGIAICGDAVLPTGLFSFTIPTTDNYKIIGRTVNTQDSLISFRMRLI